MGLMKYLSDSPVNGIKINILSLHHLTVLSCFVSFCSSLATFSSRCTRKNEQQLPATAPKLVTLIFVIFTVLSSQHKAGSRMAEMAGGARGMLFPNPHFSA